MNIDEQKNHSLNFIFRLLAFIISFINIRLVVQYLGNDLYGAWATILTILNWMNVSDFGIGNGLRNNLATAYASNDKVTCNKYITSAFVILSKLAGILWGISMVVIAILVFSKNIEDYMILPIIISISGFCVNFILGIFRSVSHGLQKAYYVTVILFLTEILNLLSVGFLMGISEKNLLLYSISSVISMTIPNILLLIYLKKKYRDIFLFEKNVYKKEYGKSVINLGLGFFILQINSILLFSTDNFIIKIFISNEAVTFFDIINKVYKSGNEVFSIPLVIVWSSVAYYWAQNNKIVIIKLLKKLWIFWVLYSIGVCVISTQLNTIIAIWMGKDFYFYNDNTIFVFALFNILQALSGVYVNINNGIGNIKIQIIFSSIGAVLNLVLSIFMVYILDWGIVGVKLATCISMLCWILPVMLVVHKSLRDINK